MCDNVTCVLSGTLSHSLAACLSATWSWTSWPTSLDDMSGISMMSRVHLQQGHPFLARHCAFCCQALQTIMPHDEVSQLPMVFSSFLWHLMWYPELNLNFIYFAFVFTYFYRLLTPFCCLHFFFLSNKQIRNSRMRRWVLWPVAFCIKLGCAWYIFYMCSLTRYVCWII